METEIKMKNESEVVFERRTNLMVQATSSA